MIRQSDIEKVLKALPPEIFKNFKFHYNNETYELEIHTRLYHLPGSFQDPKLLTYEEDLEYTESYYKDKD